MTRRVRQWTARTALAAAGTLLAMACGAPPGVIDVSSYPPPMQKRYQLFEQRCSRCHDLARPINARVADGGWHNYVRRMSRHPGAGISPSDQAQIAQFLEFHHRRGDGPQERRRNGE